MTKKEIVKAISEDLGLTQLQTKKIVQKTFDAIIDTLVEEGRIELRNFGVFEVKKRAARKARNPRTGDEVEVAEKFVVTFKPGKYMEERVKNMTVHPDDRPRLESTGPDAPGMPGTPPAPTPNPGATQTPTQSPTPNPPNSGGGYPSLYTPNNTQNP